MILAHWFDTDHFWKRNHIQYDFLANIGKNNYVFSVYHSSSLPGAAKQKQTVILKHRQHWMKSAHYRHISWLHTTWSEFKSNWVSHPSTSSPISKSASLKCSGGKTKRLSFSERLSEESELISDSDSDSGSDTGYSAQGQRRYWAAELAFMRQHTPETPRRDGWGCS